MIAIRMGDAKHSRPTLIAVFQVLFAKMKNTFKSESRLIDSRIPLRHVNTLGEQPHH